MTKQSERLWSITVETSCKTFMMSWKFKFLWTFTSKPKFVKVFVTAFKSTSEPARPLKDKVLFQKMDKFPNSHIVPLCGNLRSFLLFRFYVKSILENLEVQKRPFFNFRGSEFV